MTGLELVVGGWFASAVIGKLADKVRSYIGDQYEYQTTKIKDNLKSLEGNMTKIQAAIHAADQRHIENPGLKKWLLDLKDACYDAEDVLDLFEYQLLEDKVKEYYQLLEDKVKQKSQVSRTFAKKLKGVGVTAKRLLFSDDNLNELLAVVDRFEKLENQMGGFLHLLSLDRSARDREGDGSEIMEWRSTDSDFKEPKLFGRDTEKSQLIKLLQDERGDEVGPSRETLHVLPIVGIGGVGKTTLAQSVYNEQKKNFKLTAWVCVSDKWELRRLMVEIIESAKIEKPPDFYHIKSLDRIRQVLKEGLMGKRFILVLDDVWNEKLEKWEKLRSALELGNDGSKVIVTTRSHEIADMMGTKKAISLGGLADKEYWQFFLHCAFGGVRPEDHTNLIFFAEKIVKKLGGLPLAAKVIGGVLKSNLNEQHWKKILESKWWKVDRQKDQIMPVLQLSYDYLPAHLKQCFVYCSLFPKDYCFTPRKLVWLWMAQGYIQDNEENTMENIGDDYFEELLSRSFFEELSEDKYVIHDLLHDLAQYLSDGESFTADDRMSDIKPVDVPKRVRHIYISANNLPIVFNDKYAKKNLRSLVVCGRCDDISLDILDELYGLRALLMEFDDFSKISFSCSFKKMLHLRYLQIDYQEWDLPVLPQALGKLYHLQVLSLTSNTLPEEDPLFSLPKGINRLINLRHFDPRKMTGILAGIGALTCLQELKFSVKKEKGFEIWQLRDMSQLTELSIWNLENVESEEEASEARLCNKRNLIKLVLSWKTGSHSDHGGVLEGLEPPQNLEDLDIGGYNGKCTPSWWSSGNCLTYLNHIRLDNCSSWEILPPFGQLRLLRHLFLYKMEAVKQIGPEFYYGSNNTINPSSFPSLETLVVKDMPELVEWYKPEEGEGVQPFPRLSRLKVQGCPKLLGPLCLPSHLKQLKLQDRYDYGCDEGINLGGCPDISRLMEWIPTWNLASMEKIKIEFREIKSFTTEQEEWFQHLTSLQSLSFSGCRDLQSLPSILSLSTLRELYISYCSNLQSLPEEGLPSSLCELSIYDCSNLKSLPEEGLPSSMTKLNLRRNSQELEERCREGGLDWHKISHIANLRIQEWW